GTKVPSNAGTAKSLSVAVPVPATARSESAPIVMMPAATKTATAAATRWAARELLFGERLRFGISQGISRARWNRSRRSVTTPDFGVRTQPPSFRSNIALSDAYAWKGARIHE